MRGLIALCLVLLGVPVGAQQLVVSEEPEAVSLTVYRYGPRGNQPIQTWWPAGYALVTETRTVTIPAGETLIRFQAVADGMYPESAIVTGLPKGVKEKNRDARLLSPFGLVDAYLKREVTLSRTNEKTGKVTKEQAIVTSGPNGGVIVQTEKGFEALKCGGLPETMKYPGVPANLSAKPTLSVITQSDKAVTAKLTLTYMAGGFDWQANYVAQVTKSEPLEKSKVDIFAWLTVANGGTIGFANANLMAIAGDPNRVNGGYRGPAAPVQYLYYQCWPDQRTDEVPERGNGRDVYDAYPSPPPPPPMMEMAVPISVVSADRLSRKSAMPVAAVVAQQEDLGDLKLYRVPEPVSVNAKGQKQVAMIVKPDAEFERIYKSDTSEGYAEGAPMSIILKGENKKEKGLGLPMPSGQVMLFEDSSYGPLVTQDRGTLKDRAVGEKVELFAGFSPDVRVFVNETSTTKKRQSYAVKITNARDTAVRAEVEIPFEIDGKPSGIKRIDGIPTWKGTIPANGEISFTYSVKLQ